MKKTLTLAAALIAAATFAGGAGLTAKAAVKENVVADGLITESGILNEVDWLYSSSGSVYHNNSEGSYITMKDAGGYIQPYNKIDFSKGDGVFEFDVLSRKSGSIRPLIHTGLTGAYTNVWISQDSIDCSATTGLPDRIEVFADYECTEAYSAPRPNVGAWFNGLGNVGNYGTHFKLTYKADGTLGIQTYKINADGTTTPSESIFIKNAYTEIDSSQAHYVGMQANGAMNIDNLKVSNGNEVIQETDCSGTDWVETEGLATQDKVLLMSGAKVVKESSLNIIAPANTDRIVSEEPIKIDENVAAAFTLSGEMKVNELTQKFGFAFGLAEQTTSVSDSSYVYIYNKEDLTYIASNGTGDEVSLGKNLAAEEYVEFTFKGTKDGTVTAVIDGVEATFTDMKTGGYVAIVTDGEGTSNVSLSSATKLLGYKYRASTGGTIANNFNTGYINGENWVVNSDKAKNFVDSTKAEGLVVEDGSLFFKGTTLGAWFGTVDSYADYILEFDYTSVAKNERPAVKDEWATGHSSLVVILGGTSGSGWANGLMCELKETTGKVQFHNFKDSPASYPVGSGQLDFGADETTAKTTAFKFVVAENNVKIYAQDVTSAPFDKANYVLLAETSVGDTFGTISFASDDCGYFKLDDVRVTPVDDPNPAVVAERIAEYRDKEAISDEHRPYDLDAPEISLNGNVVSWNAVEGATGYTVIINGKESAVQTATAYTIEETAAGSYVISVKAVGNGTYIGDSEQSDTVTYVVNGTGGSSSEPTPPPDKTSTNGGCNSVVGVGSVVAIGALAVALAVGKRRRR